MTTVLHVVPVGLSLTSKGKVQAVHGALPDDDLPLGGSVGDLLETAADDVTTLLTAAQRAAIAATGTDACAEWSSIGTAHKQPTMADVDGQAYVLLATDTDEGLRDAVCVAARYGTPVRYVHEPLQLGRLIVAPGEVYVCRVPHLDLSTKQSDAAQTVTWTSLGAVGRAVADTAGSGRWRVLLHLSGGYKAMIPYLMQWAEAVNTRLRNVDLSADLAALEAVALHETSVDRGAPVLVTIPVRAFGGDLPDEVRTFCHTVGRGTPTVTDALPGDLRDMLWTADHYGRPQLTPAGLIMANVW